jgi:hypothetical protein
MKILLIILGALVLLAAILIMINPVVMLLTRGKSATVKTKAEVREHSLVCTLILEEAKSPMFITSFDAPRATAEKIGLGPPDGFTAELLHDRKSDSARIAEWNRERLHFVGKQRIEPGVPLTIVFPLKATAPVETWKISGLYESGRTLGNMISGFSINVEMK